MITKIVFSPDQLDELINVPGLITRVRDCLRTVPGCTVLMAMAFAKHQLTLEFPVVADDVHVDTSTGEVILPKQTPSLANRQGSDEVVKRSGTNDLSPDKGSDKALYESRKLRDSKLH